MKDFLWKNAIPNAAINGLEYIIENLQKRAMQVYKDAEEGDPVVVPARAAAAASATTATATTATTATTPAIPSSSSSSSSSLSMLKNVLEELDVYSNILSTKTKEVIANKITFAFLTSSFMTLTHHTY